MTNNNYAPPTNGAVFFLEYDLFMDPGTRFLNEELLHDFQEEIIVSFCKQFRSFSACAISYKNQIKKVAENKIFWLGFADNDWGLAVLLLPKDVNAGLIKTHTELYQKGLENTLLKIFPKIGVYVGPYTCETKEANPNPVSA